MDSPLTLRPSKLKAIWLVLGSLVFVILGILFAHENLFMGILSVLFFGLCFVVGVVQLYYLQRDYFLVDKSGITIRKFGKTRHVDWQDIEEFYPIDASNGSVRARATMLGIRYSATFAQKNISDKVRVVGELLRNPVTDKDVWDTYGYKAVDLAKLLNDRKQHYSSDR